MAMAAQSNYVVNRVVLALALALALGVLGSPSVDAEMIGSGDRTASPSLSGSTSISKIEVGSVIAQAPGELVNMSLYSGNTLLTGASVSQFEVNIPAAGQLTIHLEDLDFPSAADALSFALVDQGEVVGLLDGAGNLTLQIGGAATMYAFVYAVAAPGTNIASYYLDVSHQFEQPVPLPAAIWLLLSGIGYVGWLGRRRRT